MERTDWSQEAREEFGRTEVMKVGEGKVDEKLKKVTERINREVGKKRKRIGRIWKGGWWDEKCRRKKKEIGTLLSEWKRARKDKEEYRRGKKE